MRNMQQWNFIEEQLHQYYMEERMRHKSSKHVCAMCSNMADYLVSGYDKNPFDEEFKQHLCAKHADKITGLYREKGSKMKFRQEPI
jgi:hypothetical protein